MGIMKRFFRICSADVNSVMDEMENPVRMLSQCMREMEESLAEIEREIEKMSESKTRLNNAAKRLSEERDRWEEDLSLAIAQHSDNSARFIIRKMKVAESHRDRLFEESDSLAQKIQTEKQRYKEARMVYDDLRLRAQAIFAEERAKRHQDKAESEKGFVNKCRVPDPTEEEVEWELSKRKQTMAKGGSPCVSPC